ncbi:MAG: hypothetical protein RR565_06490 [Erysipelothrix sp.]
MLTHIEDLNADVGKVNGYYFVIGKNSITFSINNERDNEQKDFKKFLKEKLSDIFTLSFTWENSILTVNTKKKNMLSEEIAFYAEIIVDYFIRESIPQVCQYSLEQENVRLYRINNDILFLSPEVYAEEKIVAEDFYERSGNRMNSYLKIIAGSLLLGLAWFIISQMGYIVYVISIGMIVLSYYIFEKNSGRPSKTDSVLIFAINFVTIMISEYLSMAYKFYKLFESQISFSEIFTIVMPYAFSDSEILWTYIGNIAFGAVALIIVSFIFAKSASKEQNKIYTAYPINIDNA